MPTPPNPEEFPNGFVRSGVELDGLGASAMLWGAHALARRSKRSTDRAARLRKAGQLDRAQVTLTAARREGLAAGRLYLQFEDQFAKARISALAGKVLGLRGRLLDANGEAVADHTVLLTDAGGRAVYGHATTDFRGWFAFRASAARGKSTGPSHLAVGPQLRASADGHGEEALNALVETYGHPEMIKALAKEVGDLALLTALLQRIGDPARLQTEIKRTGGAEALAKKLGVSAAAPQGMVARPAGTGVLQARDRNGIVIAQREIRPPRMGIHLRVDLRLGTGRGRHGVPPGGEIHVDPPEPGPPGLIGNLNHG